MDYDLIARILSIPLQDPVHLPVVALIITSLIFGMWRGMPWTFLIVVGAIVLVGYVESTLPRRAGTQGIDGEYFQLFVYTAFFHCAVAYLFGWFAERLTRPLRSRQTY